jgi:hypothetical protein
MKISHHISSLLLILILLCTSCEQDVSNIKPLDVSSKLVVTSFISPQDTLIKVQLQKTQPSIGKQLSEEQLMVLNATVTISDGSSTKMLDYNPKSKTYEADAKVWPIKEGTNYLLKIVDPKGYKAEASCSVPTTNGIKISDFNTSFTEVKENYYAGTIHKYNAILKWQDAPEVENYYRTIVYMESMIPGPSGKEQLIQQEFYFRNLSGQLFKDDKVQGKTFISEPMEYYHYKNDEYPKIKSVFAILAVTDRNYYLFHQSIFSQYRAGYNPFSEPSLIYTNIKGGLGVFAAYNQLTVKKSLQ